MLDQRSAQGTRRIGLLGIGLEDLCDAEGADQPDLFSDGPKHHAGIEKAMDAVRAKFGRKAIGKGRAAKSEISRNSW